jgi:serine/threonine protein kinase
MSPENHPDVPLSAEDALSKALSPTDDTPTIISRGPAPSAAELDTGRGIRGRRLAHFELIEPIGVGGMAAVLRARDLQLDRFVALKILPPEMAADPEAIRRFHQEARSAAKLDHENIARVFFCGEDQRLHFIAFEFVEGENLRAIIDRRGRLPVGEAVHYMLQVAAGLAHASQRGVVHRDIKPSNIIITPAGRAKLVDMGLARSLDSRGNDDLTQSGVTLGTFDYISPEQALEPRTADCRSDIYSLGCTFYHALTGQPPVPEGTAAKKLHHHQHIKPADPRDLVPGLPLEVVRVLDRMIAKDPRERFQTPEQLVQALLGVAKLLGAGPGMPEGMLSVETPMPPRGRPLIWMALGLSLVVGAVLVLDPGGTNSPTPRTPRPSNANKGARPEPKDPPVPTVVGTPKKGTTSETREPVILTLDAETKLSEIRAAAARHADADLVILELAGDISLSDEEGGLVLRAREKVIVRATAASSRPTLRLRYKAAPGPSRLAVLTIQAPESEIQRVRVVADLAGGAVPLCGMHLRGGRSHSLRDCVFVQVAPPSEKKLESLLVSAEQQRPQVQLKDCVFFSYARGNPDPPYRFSEGEIGGQDAICLQGQVNLSAENCALAPHTTMLRLDDPLATAELIQSTVLLPAKRSAVFSAEGGKLRARRCLIARLPGILTGEETGAVLIRQENDKMVTFEGSDNAYFDLDGYWSLGNSWTAAGWGAFKERLSATKGTDDSRRLLSSPWALTGGVLRKELNDEQAAAFQPHPSHKGLRLRGNPERMLGAREVLGTVWTAKPLDEKPDSERRILTVEPKVDDAPNGVYPSIYRAIQDARPGETILLRHEGKLVTEHIELKKKEYADVILKSARHFRPELVFNERTTEPDAALFRLYDGKLRLESLDVTLDSNPGTAETRSEEAVDSSTHALLALVGNGSCVMRDCVINLVKGDIPVTLASLNPAGNVMRVPGMPPSNPRELWPHLTLENCQVRGEGEVLLARAPRRVALTLKNCLVALNGSVVRVEHNGGGEAAMPPMSSKMSLTMTQVTAYLGAPLIRMLARNDPRGMLPLEVDASSSLFLPSNGVESLIALEAPEREDVEMKFRWKSSGGKNAFGKFPTLLAIKGGEMAMGTAMMDMDLFKKMEPNVTNTVTPERMPAAGTRYGQIRPSDIKGPASVGTTLP